MYKNSIKNLINLKDVCVKNVCNYSNRIEIHVEMPKNEQFCPCCHAKTSKVHDYRIQKVKFEPILHLPTFLMYKKRRYECSDCKKIFIEENNIVPKYKRTSTKLIEYIVNELRTSTPAKNIAKKANVSPCFISKLLPFLAVRNTHLPRVLCIDEFKGNAGKYKYQVILLDGETHKIVDIVECRYKHSLSQYFKQYPEAERNNVKVVVSDLWKTYQDLAFTYFRKAIHVADHFHFIRYAIEAVDKIRRRVQSRLPKKDRIYFKHSRSLLLGKLCNVQGEQRLKELELMLTNYSEDLRIAYVSKENLNTIFYSNQSYEEKVKQLSDWILNAQSSKIKELVECANTFQHWFQSIRNSLKVPYSNGPTEGKNNKIKVLKRITYGMRNFLNFKARIMLLDN